MNIGMILERQFPFDERVEKEALSLVENGHTVYIFSFNYDGLPDCEDIQDIHILRFPIKRITYNKLSPLHRVFPLYKMTWKKVLRKFLKDIELDVIHVHDLPLANVGYWVKKRKKCLFVLDQHELWSETVKHYRHYNTFIGKIVRFLSFWASYEKRQFKKADKILTVEEPIKQWYIKHTGTQAEKIVVAPNTPSLKQVSDIRAGKYKEENKFILYYAGKIDHNRYLNSVIAAFPELTKEIPEIQFNIAGNIAKGCDPRDTAKVHQVESHINYLGQLSYEDMMQYMKDADICISLLPSYSEELNRTIVTKIYQYVQLEKPMIVSRTDYIREFVTGNNIGQVVIEDDPASIADIIRTLYHHPELLEEYAQNAAKIKSDFVWEKTVQPMINMYNDLGQKR